MAARAQRAAALVAAVTCLATSSSSTTADKVKRAVPLSAAIWTVDLRQYGYDPARRPQPLWTFQGLGSSATEEVVATFVTHDPPRALQRRDDPQRQLPFHLHVVFLDSANGKLRQQAALGSESLILAVAPRVDGSFVTLGERLVLYAPDLTPRSEIKVSLPPGEVSHILGIRASPSGQTILIRFGNDRFTSCIWVTGDDHLAARQEKCSMPPEAVISDSEIATPAWDKQAGASSDRRVAATVIRTFDGSWRTLCKVGTAPCGWADFLSEDFLLVWGAARPGWPTGDTHAYHAMFRVLRDDGSTISSGPNVEVPSNPSPHFYLAERSLLAFPVFDDGLSAVLVYNVSTGKRFFQVKNPETNGIRRLQRLAMTRDGKYLLVQGDAVLRCYVLPPGQ